MLERSLQVIPSDRIKTHQIEAMFSPTFTPMTAPSYTSALNKEKGIFCF